ncbi:MAG: hypothetical protein H6617_03410 [Bdellovibrionaceae bacterium]|nr:hypothetical protein [Bdellovibrionales bacterium]MCB9253707.1 hypothetical protein [Pseudobdellovibrionaceae bacterium]
MKNLSWLAVVVGVQFLFVSAQAATISGKIGYGKDAPKDKPIRMNADPYCASANKANPATDERIVVNSNKTLKNVFVYIKSGAKKGTAPSQAVVFDQKGCVYHPHVIGVQVGQPFDILNSDATLHNVHSMAKKNAGFNMGMATKGQKVTKTFSKPETMIKFKCDVHGWMTAYVGVVDNPYFAVTGDDGSFTLKDVPPGDYTIEAWHEKLKTKTATVKVAGAGDTKTVDFSF